MDDICYYEKCVIQDVPNDMKIEHDVCPPEAKDRADQMITATLALQLNLTTYAGPIWKAMVAMARASPSCLRFPNPQLDGPFAGGIDLKDDVYNNDFSGATSLRAFEQYVQEHKDWDRLVLGYNKCVIDTYKHSEVVMDLGHWYVCVCVYARVCVSMRKSRVV